MVREMVKKIVRWGIVFACLIYIISPIDLLPEGVLGPFGFIDDLIAGFVGLSVAFGDAKSIADKITGGLL